MSVRGKPDELCSRQLVRFLKPDRRDISDAKAAFQLLPGSP